MGISSAERPLSHREHRIGRPKGESQQQQWKNPHSGRIEELVTIKTTAAALLCMKITNSSRSLMAIRVPLVWGCPPKVVLYGKASAAEVLCMLK